MSKKTEKNLEEGSLNENDHAYEGKGVEKGEDPAPVPPLNVEKLRKKKKDKK
jgi:hypothetical protein